MSSTVLYGRNVCANNLEKIDYSKVKQDLLYKLHQYFYRIEAFLINDPDIFSLKIGKYLRRVIIDILLYKDDLLFTDVTKISNESLIKIVTEKDYFSKSTKQYIEIISSINKLLEQQKFLFRSLKNDYLNLYEQNNV